LGQNIGYGAVAREKELLRYKRSSTQVRWRADGVRHSQRTIQGRSRTETPGVAWRDRTADRGSPDRAFFKAILSPRGGHPLLRYNVLRGLGKTCEIAQEKDGESHQLFIYVGTISFRNFAFVTFYVLHIVWINDVFS